MVKLLKKIADSYITATILLCLSIVYLNLVIFGLLSPFLVDILAVALLSCSGILLFIKQRYGE